MKSLSKIIAKIFLTIIIFCNLFFVFGVNFSYAAEKNLKEKCMPGVDSCKEGQCLQTGYSTYQCIKFSAQVPIPDTPYVQPQNSTKALGEYIKGLYNYFIGITAIVATIILMIGGFQWVVAGGNSSKIEEAKSWIMGALSGLALALGSYMILGLITPNLVNFKVHNIEPIKPPTATGEDGCCLRPINGTTTAFETKESGCKNPEDVFKKGFKKNGNNCEHPCQLPAKIIIGGMLDDPESENKCKNQCTAEGKQIDTAKSFNFSREAYCCACK